MYIDRNCIIKLMTQSAVRNATGCYPCTLAERCRKKLKHMQLKCKRSSTCGQRSTSCTVQLACNTLQYNDHRVLVMGMGMESHP